MKRWIVLTLAAACVLLCLGALAWVLGAPGLPDEIEEEIERTLAAPLPELVIGEAGVVQSGGYSIWYERQRTTRPPARGSVLLVTGIAIDALAWPQPFLDALRACGYDVVRSDHRGTGASSARAVDGADAAYSLVDMADDGIAVLDALDIERAHVVGVSMGGMIAQRLALLHPSRVETLGLLMTSPDIEARDLPPIRMDTAVQLARIGIRYGLLGGERNLVRMHVASRRILAVEEPTRPDTAAIAQQVAYNERHRGRYRLAVSREHQDAVRRGGSHAAQLRGLEIPTVVLHGRADPFIPLAHGERLAALIPDARAHWIDGLGHDIPPGRADEIAGLLCAHFRAAGAAAVAEQ